MCMTSCHIPKIAVVTILGRRILFLVLLSVSAGCSINPVNEKRQIMLVSKDLKIAMGRDAAPSPN